MTTPTQTIQQYYQSLLILQYLGKPKAYATIGANVLPLLLPDSNIQGLNFTGAPASGSFELSYAGISTASIAWNATIGTIQTDLQAILPSPITVVVTGSISAGLIFTFSNYLTAISILTLSVNSLLDISSTAVLASISPIGAQLPLEVLNAYNLTGPSIAVGLQLDVLGKYVGVTRTGNGFFGPITLDDADFLSLIQMGIVKNNAGSSLADIQSFLNQFFAGDIFVFDYQNMNMSYLISTSIGSQNVIDLFVTEGLLPKPMGVGLSVIAAPIINKFFGFVSYSAPTQNPITTPLNTYSSYQTSWLFLTYADAITL